MDISVDVFDIWSTHWLDYIDNSESIEERIDQLAAPPPQLDELFSLSLRSLTGASSNIIENHPIGNSIPATLTDSNKNFCEVKEFSDAIDAYFSTSYPSTDKNETEPQLINNSNSIQYLSSSLTCYNSSFNTPFNSLSPINSIGHQNLNPNYQNANIEALGCKKLSLAKDCSQVKEPWIPSVSKKLLASYYSPLSMKSELLSNQIMLDAYESVTLQEAVQAFKDIAFADPHCDTNLALAIQFDFYSDPRPLQLVYSCEKLRAYRKLNTEDKIKLMARAFFDINAIKAIITYDETVDGWCIAGELWPRTSISWESPNLLELQNMIETFPDCLRNDINVVALLYLIVIFNPDAPKLKFRNGIRQEQYIYIHLLKRYLVSLFGSTCEASDYHYRLMAKIEQTIKLPDNLIFEHIQLGCTEILRNRVVKLVQHKGQ